VSDNRASAAVTEAFQERNKAANRARRRKGLARVTNRIKAWANQKREPWLVFSPRNQEAIRKVALAEVAAEFQKLPR
jgi:hypothetical protein